MNQSCTCIHAGRGSSFALFREIAPSRNDQFLIATHSPVFVSPDTIDNVTRIHRQGGSGSDRVALRDVELPGGKSLVRMINSQNNERVFFADKVVLVEGISDRLVMASVLDGVASRCQNYEAVEIVEVGGKHNFDDYRTLLGGLQTPAYVVADLDYLLQVGSDGGRGLFQASPTKEWQALKGKRSLDGATAMALLREATAAGDTSTLTEFLTYLEGRCVRLKDPLSDVEQTTLAEELASLRGERIFLLSGGEIEAYLPEGVRDVRSIVEAIVEADWINSVTDVARRIELIGLACEILGASDLVAEALRQEAEEGTVAFAPPLSRRAG